MPALNGIVQWRVTHSVEANTVRPSARRVAFGSGVFSPSPDSVGSSLGQREPWMSANKVGCHSCHPVGGDLARAARWSDAPPVWRITAHKFIRCVCTYRKPPLIQGRCRAKARRRDYRAQAKPIPHPLCGKLSLKATDEVIS